MTYEAATSVWAILEAFLTPHSSVSPTANGLLLVAVVTAALCLGILAVRQWGAKLGAVSGTDS